VTDRQNYQFFSILLEPSPLWARRSALKYPTELSLDRQDEMPTDHGLAASFMTAEILNTLLRAPLDARNGTIRSTALGFGS
jgi:hypothetical protein